jgi:serine/threonine-protein kinase
VVLNELLSGKRLFAGLPGAVMHRLLHDEALSLAGSARDATEAAAFAPFEAIVARATARDRERRYANAQEMLDALTQAADFPIAPRVSVAATQRLMARPEARAAAQVHWLPRRPLPEPANPLPAPSCGAAPAGTQFDAAALAALEALLVPTLGPIARVVVKRTAARSHGLVALVARLAEEVLPFEERREFIGRAEQALRAFDSPASPVPHRPCGTEPRRPPVLGSTPLRDESVHRCERLLAHHIGPIARVMAKHARERADSHEQFIVLLADQAAGCVDRDGLLAELRAAR